MGILALLLLIAGSVGTARRAVVSYATVEATTLFLWTCEWPDAYEDTSEMQYCRPETGWQEEEGREM